MISVALIVTFNRLEKLKMCWAITARQSFNHIVIVNNASSDGTKEWLNELDDHRLHLLNCQENAGGAGGFKKGATYIANNLKADWVFIYDDDAWPQDNIIENFLQLKQLNTCDAFACKVVNRHNQLCKMNLPWKKFPKSFRENVNYKSSSKGYVAEPDINAEVLTFSFVGLIIRYDALVDNIEYIYEELFIYFDDVYFSLHLSSSGYKIEYTPDIHFIHDVPDSSTNLLAPWKVYYLVRNMIMDKNFLGNSATFTFPFKAMRLVKYAILMREQPQKIGYLRYFLKGILDGVSAKAGRRH